MERAARSLEKADGERGAPTHARAATLQSSSSPPQGAFGNAPIQQTAGNLAIQRLFNAGLIQGKLSVSQPNDPYEQEADRVSDHVMSMPEPQLQRVCACGGSCPKCQTNQQGHGHERLQTKQIGSSYSRETAAPSTVHEVLSTPGRPLDPAARGFFEPRLGVDLGDVRVHTDRQADTAARAISARAFTLGSDVVFGEGQYRPQSDDGQRLLAHELTHVLQQNGSDAEPRIQRQLQCQRGDGWFPGMRAKLLKNVYEVNRVRFRDGETVELTSTPHPDAGGYHRIVDVQLLDPHSPRSGPHPVDVYDIEPVDAAQAAALSLFSAGASEFGLQSVLTMPRPFGLPVEEGYTLQLVPGDLPTELAARIPEGQIVTLTPDMLATRVSEPDRLSNITEGLGGGAYAGLRGANTALMNFGFAPAGEFAIGLVAIPPANMNPLSPHFNPIDLAAPLERAGHTAVYVRQGGKITIVRGYNPQMNTPSSFWNVARNQGDIFSGKMGVPGEITSDAPLFKSTAARTIEYPVTRDVAARLAHELPPLGPPGPGQPPQYTAPPSEYGRITGTQPGCVGTNCGLWATQQAETVLRGRIGIAGEPPIVDVPVQGQASQGKLYDMLGRVAKGAPTTETPGASGGPIAGRMSPGLKVLKWGGRTFMVVSVAKLGYDIVTAPAEERLHVAVVGGSSLLGGIAGGAALGLVCGPGAPVCMIITGTIGGILGGLGAGELAETLWQSGEAMETAGEVFNPIIERAIWGDRPNPAMGYYPPRQYLDNPYEYEAEKARYMRSQGGR